MVDMIKIVLKFIPLGWINDQWKPLEYNPGIVEQKATQKEMDARVRGEETEQFNKQTCLTAILEGLEILRENSGGKIPMAVRMQEEVNGQKTWSADYFFPQLEEFGAGKRRESRTRFWNLQVTDLGRELGFED